MNTTMNAQVTNGSESTLDNSTSSLSAVRAKVTATSKDLAPTIARVALGAVMFPHGAQKALGWFGGPGLSGPKRA